jgi:hypothetical protein
VRNRATDRPRYVLLHGEAYDCDEMRIIRESDIAAWREFQQWLSIGNVLEPLSVVGKERDRDP